MPRLSDFAIKLLKYSVTKRFFFMLGIVLKVSMLVQKYAGCRNNFLTWGLTEMLHLQQGNHYS